MPEKTEPAQDFDSLITVDHPDVDSQPDNQTKALLFISKDGMRPTAFYQQQVIRLQLDLGTVNQKLHAIEIQKGVVDADLAKFKERTSWVRCIEGITGVIVCIATAVKSCYPGDDLRAIVAVTLLAVSGLVLALLASRRK